MQKIESTIEYNRSQKKNPFGYPISSLIFPKKRETVWPSPRFPHLLSLEQRLSELPAFASARPDQQPDAIP